MAQLHNALQMVDWKIHIKGNPFGLMYKLKIKLTQITLGNWAK